MKTSKQPGKIHLLIRIFQSCREQGGIEHSGSFTLSRLVPGRSAENVWSIRTHDNTYRIVDRDAKFTLNKRVSRRYNNEDYQLKGPFVLYNYFARYICSYVLYYNVRSVTTLLMNTPPKKRRYTS